MEHDRYKGAYIGIGPAIEIKEIDVAEYKAILKKIKEKVYCDLDFGSPLHTLLHEIGHYFTLLGTSYGCAIYSVQHFMVDTFLIALKATKEVNGFIPLKRPLIHEMRQAVAPYVLNIDTSQNEREIPEEFKHIYSYTNILLGNENCLLTTNHLVNFPQLFSYDQFEHDKNLPLKTREKFHDFRKLAEKEIERYKKRLCSFEHRAYKDELVNPISIIEGYARFLDVLSITKNTQKYDCFNHINFKNEMSGIEFKNFSDLEDRLMEVGKNRLYKRFNFSAFVQRRYGDSFYTLFDIFKGKYPKPVIFTLICVVHELSLMIQKPIFNKFINFEISGSESQLMINDRFKQITEFLILNVEDVLTTIELEIQPTIVNHKVPLYSDRLNNRVLDYICDSLKWRKYTESLVALSGDYRIGFNNPKVGEASKFFYKTGYEIIQAKTDFLDKNDLLWPTDLLNILRFFIENSIPMIVICNDGYYSESDWFKNEAQEQEVLEKIMDYYIQRDLAFQKDFTISKKFFKSLFYNRPNDTFCKFLERRSYYSDIKEYL